MGEGEGGGDTNPYRMLIKKKEREVQRYSTKWVMIDEKNQKRSYIMLERTIFY